METVSRAFDERDQVAGQGVGVLRAGRVPVTLLVEEELSEAVARPAKATHGTPFKRPENGQFSGKARLDREPVLVR